MSLIDSTKAGVGNYKGVMLCNRPFAGTKAAHGGSGGEGGSSTFKAGVIPEPLGIPIPLSAKDAKKLHRPKKETVLTKHRKWLADLQRTKDSLEIQLIDEMTKKAEGVQRFQEQEKRMRLAAKELLRAEDKDEAQSDTNGGDKWDKGGVGPESSPGAPSSAAASPAEHKAEAKAARGGKALSAKPAWALTEHTAEEKARLSEERELDDEEGLLDFAQSLDLERFLGDIEVKAMMTQLAQRIGQLEREVAQDEKREADMDPAQRQRNREMLLEALEEQRQRGQEGQGDKGPSEESKMFAVASALLDADEGGMGNVHSKKSVASMLLAAKEKIANVANSVAMHRAAAVESEGKEARVTGGPIIVVHEPSEGTRINGGKETVSNLPYQHRNPAV